MEGHTCWPSITGAVFNLHRGIPISREHNTQAEPRPGASSGGEPVFSGMDPKHFKGDHTYVHVSRKGYWQINTRDLLTDGHSTGFYAKGCAATVDSRTSLLADPTAIVAQKFN
uniref:Peptidase A1 domain-containing protein n=1 Tax=Oryza glumipatula TaxID=40148 RepID=A0A0E0ARB1_9ORYZ